ncbi:MAG: hypothetical protein KY462_09295 [Actinobacteria bacterium]|nr:hypothetical protein [Actinomycetota bacterium]
MGSEITTRPPGFEVVSHQPAEGGPRVDEMLEYVGQQQLLEHRSLV